MLLLLFSSRPGASTFPLTSGHRRVAGFIRLTVSGVGAHRVSRAPPCSATSVGRRDRGVAGLHFGKVFVLAQNADLFSPGPGEGERHRLRGAARLHVRHVPFVGGAHGGARLLRAVQSGRSGASLGRRRSRRCGGLHLAPLKQHTGFSEGVLAIVLCLSGGSSGDSTGRGRSLCSKNNKTR